MIGRSVGLAALLGMSPASADSPPPAPVEPPPAYREKPPLVIVVSGGISRGSYLAGQLYTGSSARSRRRSRSRCRARKARGRPRTGCGCPATTTPSRPS